ncbi:hypothetical protein [Cellvibrio mixtus]|uniref:hypothetical protein n=1 Tax=Cellvibrio mixtus TaxID=39650 RepID=UPI000587B350|nr:hypothetical protein [Cellvibrio mixtus]
MALSENVKLGAGAKLSYRVGGGSGAFTLLPNALVIGPVGAQGGFVDVTPIMEITEESIRGPLTAPELQMEFNHQPGKEAYATFLATARDRTIDQIEIQIDYSTGDRCTLVAIPNGVQVASPERSVQQKATVFLKQSGDEVWSTAA